MKSLFSTKKGNAIAVTGLLLNAIGVKFNQNSLQELLALHPDYPQLLSISDGLDQWHVTNQAYTIVREEYDAQDLYFPFIAHLKEKGGNYILIHQIIHQQVLYSDETNDKATMPEQEFLKRWSYVALHATTTANSGEPDYQNGYFRELLDQIKLPLLLGAILAAILLALNDQASSFSYITALTLKFAGIAVSVLLLMHSIDANNPLIQNLCSLGKKNGCNAILKSDAANVTSWLSWSEVGFYYFAGSFLSLLFAPSSIILLAWLNLLALPYTVYSILYQYKNKNWCVLCCAVQILLVLEAITFKFGGLSFSLWSFSSMPTTNSLLPLTLCFLIPILTWLILKPILLKSNLTKPLKTQLKKFKYNIDLFQQVLQQQPKYGVGHNLMPITLGNPNAETIITIVSNPFCGPCAKAHDVIDGWLSYRDDLQVKIIFSTTDHDDDEKTKVARHINALSMLNDPQIVANALNDWFKQGVKKYEKWAAEYPVKIDKRHDEVTAKQKDWCNLAEITFTPTVLVNGYKLPAPYQLEDIKYLLR